MCHMILVSYAKTGHVVTMDAKFDVLTIPFACWPLC